MPSHSDLHRKWLDAGPYSSDGNALHHLRRFNYKIEKMRIYPPPGFVPSKEERSAVTYLVTEWDYAFVPPEK